MSAATGNRPGLKLSLPATSANLGPGFDAMGLALSMHLQIEATPSTKFRIDATGRDADLCGVLKNHLILETYTDILQRAGCEVTPLHLTIHNEIPLGMGCGSSAAALLAGVALADHFGSLAMGDARIVQEASRIEGHPDNVAACWYGGFTVSATDGNSVVATTFAGDPGWNLLLAMQPTSLATKKARALLPETYPKADAIFNVQRASLLVAAFAQRRMDLLKTTMQDRMHQPYRMDACPLLKRLLPMMEDPQIAGVSLSGAGPSVLLVLNAAAQPGDVAEKIRALAGDNVEVLAVRISGGASIEVIGELSLEQTHNNAMSDNTYSV